MRDGQLSACRHHLHLDIRRIVQQYGKNNVVILALGAEAVRTLTHTTITAWLSRQGATTVLYRSSPQFIPPLPVFATYHPANLAPNRSPHLLGTFVSHLEMLKRYLATGKSLRPEFKLINGASAQSVEMRKVCSLDIETYGVLRGVEQTAFHPILSERIDGRPREHQVLTVAVAFDPSKAYVFTLADIEERSAFFSMFRRWREVYKSECVLVGHNITYDLLYLRMCFPELRLLIRPFSFYIEDTAVLNHLHDDLQPSRSLKALASTFGLADYSGLLEEVKESPNARDANLHYYNALDAITTLRLYEFFIARLKERWQSLPLDDDFRLRFRSDLLWTILHLEEHGLTFNRKALVSLYNKQRRHLQSLIEQGKQAGYTFAGSGSQKSVIGLITSALTEAGMLDDERVIRTAKTHQISIGKENAVLALEKLPASSPLRKPLELYVEYKSNIGIYNSYLKPLVEQFVDKTDGSTYPSWFAVPTFVKDAEGGTGGMRQGRIAAHRPAAQTFPPVVKDTLRSRFPDGVLLEYDLSQIELRVPALLSGDPAMCEAFQQRKDIHAQTAQLLIDAGLGFYNITDEDGFKKMRQLGKRLNFLMQYRGGAATFVEVCRSDLGLEVPLELAKRIITEYWRMYTVLRKWQDELIAFVEEHGYLITPTGWRRTFVPTENKKSLVFEICNFPVQTTAAQVFQSAHAAILREAQRRRIPLITPVQIHDALFVDTRLPYLDQVDEIVEKYMTHPPLWLRLQKIYNREVPLEYSRRIVYDARNPNNHGTDRHKRTETAAISVNSSVERQAVANQNGQTQARQRGLFDND
ncbi:MAG: hypothetical protein DRO01_05210 [Thermoproteota archaeon]|nr:MAG: hypothetical protein DRO01_05210 [Candidatus Korarchaeota archaeon]